jgi:hypothetical protein
MDEVQVGVCLRSKGRELLLCTPELCRTDTTWDCAPNLAEEPMPRFRDALLDGVVFLYPSEEDARNHTRLGGTGFLVGWEFEDIDYLSVPFIVSNRHVVWAANCPVIRINRLDGNEPDILTRTQNDWTVHPGGADVAVTRADGFKYGVHKATNVPVSKFVTPQMITDYEIGIGEEVFMVGRFLNHQGGRDNKPALRLGTISMMLESIWNKANNRWEESFAAEMRSRTGFSGSPVGVYRMPHTIMTNLKPSTPKAFFQLLGVNWGYILDKDTGENSWLNGVVPAWKILETLETPTLRQKKRESIEDWKAQQSNDVAVATAAVVPVGNDENATDANPNHREDFSSLVGAAARKREQED